jgi:hypothetical protein
VIAVALGQRPTPAYELEILAVDQITGGFVGVQTQVQYVVREPTPATPPDALTRPAYPHHVVRVKNASGLVVFRRVGEPQPTTLMVGEEGGMMTTLALGEEGPQFTTLAVGEEGGGGPPPMTTLAVGEEGGGGPTTLAVGEESWGGGPFGGF